MIKIEKVFVVFKTHFDIGFTDLACEVIKRYGKKMLSDVVKTCEDTQVLGKQHQFVWTMSAWPLLQSLSPEFADEEVIEKAEKLIRDGQITWHALPYTTHTEFCGLEELIRGLNFSAELSKRYGKWPVSAKMTDVPGHTWILPSLLSKAGVKFLHLGCNSGCMPPDVPRLFFWEGPDGSKVLVFYNKGGYGSSIIPPKNWDLPVWLALMNTGDNDGPQDPESVRRILVKAEEEMPGTEIIMGTLDDFYNEASKYLKDIPVIRKDLADSWIHGVGTYPYEVGQLRSARHVLSNTEKALSLAMGYSLFSEKHVVKYKNEVFNAYEQGILFGEHTWGLDVKSTIGVYGREYEKKEFLISKKAPQYKRLEESWKEQGDRALTVKAFGENVAPKIFDSIASAVDADGERIIVFNGLGWKRNGLVNLSEYRAVIAGRKLIDVSTGENVSISCINGCANIKDIPAVGYKTLIITDKGENPDINKSAEYGLDAGVIENKWFYIEADGKEGIIKSLIEKSTGKEWVDKSKPFGFAQYCYDIIGSEDITEFIRSYSYRFSDWLVNDIGRAGYPEQSHMSFVPGKFCIDIEKTPELQTLTLHTSIKDESVTKYGNARYLKTTITIYEDNPFIDISFELKNKEESLFVESGHFVFPINLHNTEIRINKLGSVIDPATDIPRNANNGLYCCENWVDLSDGENGMAIVAYDTPLFSIGQKEIYKFKNEYKREEPVVFFNCYNNSWGTNFPQWMSGDYLFRYRLIPHRGNWQQGEVWKHSFESIDPVLCGYASGRCGEVACLPAELEFVKPSEGVQVQAFKPAEKKDGFILRIRELKGEARNIELKIPDCFSSASICDLLERIEEDLILHEGSISYKTRPFEIYSFYLRR